MPTELSSHGAAVDDSIDTALSPPQRDAGHRPHYAPYCATVNAAFVATNKPTISQADNAAIESTILETLPCAHWPAIGPPLSTSHLSTLQITFL